jgi:nicotinamidase-related amidase
MADDLESALVGGESKLNAELISKEGTVLVVIDVQEKLFARMSKKEKLAENLAKLIQFAHIVKIPIILTEQYPKGLGQTIFPIKKLVPDLQPIEKVEFSCFGSQKFKESLMKTQAKTLIIAGIEAHICVTQTAIEGLEKGFRTYVVEDATSSRRPEDKNTAIHRMRQNAVTVVSTEMLIYELLKKAGTPEFKETLKLVK